MTPALRPVLLSPALPTELLSHVLQYHRHPTVLIICGTRQQFLSALAQDVLQQVSLDVDGHTHLAGEEEGPSLPAHQLLVAPLAQVAVSRHIRLVFVPTVTHLEAWLTVFRPGDTTIPPPPSPAPHNQEQQTRDSEKRHDHQPQDERSGRMRGNRQVRPPLLIVYGFLSLHRDTSEWSAQGIGNTAAALVEAASRTNFRAAVVEPLEFDEQGEVRRLDRLLKETVPILSGAARREIDEGGWTGRTVDVERIMRRWFVVEAGGWEVNRAGVVPPLPTQPDEQFSQTPEEVADENEAVHAATDSLDIRMSGMENLYEESRDGLDSPDLDDDTILAAQDGFG